MAKSVMWFAKVEWQYDVRIMRRRLKAKIENVFGDINCVSFFYSKLKCLFLILDNSKYPAGIIVTHLVLLQHSSCLTVAVYCTVHTHKYILI